MLDDLIACFAALGMFVTLLFVLACILEFRDSRRRH